MAAPKNIRLKADFDEWFPVEFACAHQPVPPSAVAGLPFRPVVLEGMTAPATDSTTSTSAGRPSGGAGSGVKAAA